MTQKPKKKKFNFKNIKLKRDWSFYVIVVCSVIIAIPLLFLGYVAISASRGAGSPALGHRFDNDLDPAIEQAQIDEIMATIEGFEGVESSFSSLTTATLRVYLYAPEMAEDGLKDLAHDAYDAVVEVLDPALYFTIQDVAKQYDLEIHVYNQLEVSEETRDDFVYVLRWKSSNMEEARDQVLSTPVSQEIVDYFNEMEAIRQENLRKQAEEEENPVEEAPAEEAPTEE